MSHTSEMFPGSPCFSVLQVTENWRRGGGGGGGGLLSFSVVVLTAVKYQMHTMTIVLKMHVGTSCRHGQT